AAFADARHDTDGLGGEIARRCRRANVRPLLVRRVDREIAPVRPTCFVVRSGPEAAWIERTSLRRLDDALSIDLSALGRGERPGLDRHDDPLFLVCTHGRHDVCCAERGRPLARALASVLPEQTWEVSHIGGDRFAGNVVAMPHGLYFGRVEPEQAEDVARGYLDGRVSLRHLRGRSTLPMPAQFAEHALRVALRLERIDDLEVTSVVQDAEATSVTVRTPDGDRVLTVVTDRAQPHALTCRARQEEAAPAYRVVEMTPV
ncbi:MAG TPA: sucrase ferredoxin, partial [Actinomycetota bacterium]|nr:sucrase ferredoxin [Actinomycetota bacterium]